MSEDRTRRPGDVDDQLREWMAVEAGDAPSGLVDDVMDVVARRGAAGWRARTGRMFVGAAGRYALLAVTIASGVALGILISFAVLRQYDGVGTTEPPAPTPGVIGELPLGALTVDESMAVNGRAPTAGPSGLWYELADGSGVGLLPGGAGDSTAYGLWPAGDGARVRNMVEAFASLWVADQLDGVLLRVDIGSREVIATFDVGPGRVAAGTASIWFVTADSVLRVDPASNQVVDDVQGIGGGDASIVVAGGSVWIGSGDQLIRVDERTAELAERMEFLVTRVVAGGGAVWGLMPNEVIRFETATENVSRARFEEFDSPIDDIADLAWAGDRLLLLVTVDSGNEVIQVEDGSWSVLERTPIEGDGDEMTVGFGAVWVASGPDERIVRLIPEP